jgi:hypothetical protein
MSELTMENTNVPSSGYSAKEANEVAKIILTQIGYHELVTMTGAYNFSSSNAEGRGALSFNFKGSRKANYVKVILNAGDTYDLRFAKANMGSVSIVAFVRNIYCDSLRDVFTRVTGLDLRIPRIC